jgi:Type IV secretion-system coupling protein DNA-binding domain
MYKLTHGLNGLILGWSLVAVPLWIGMRHGRAPLQKWVWSPITALGLMFVAVIVAAILGWPFGLEKHSVPQIALNLASFIAVGYLCGRYVFRSLPVEAHKRGALLQDGKIGPQTNLPQKRQGVVTLAGMEMSPEDEVKHFKIIGTTGTGKSTAIRELLTGALARGDRAIIADPDGGYQSRFYDPHRGDVILNPFDANSVRWDLFGDIGQLYDIEHLASALIPLGDEGPGREWRGYARTFFVAVTRHCFKSGRHDLGELWRLLINAPRDELKPIVAGSPAEPLLESEVAKMFGATRSVVLSAIAPLEYIKDQLGQSFSVRPWIRSGSGVLFIPYQAGQIEALRTMIAAWMKLAIFETMSGREGVDQRLWFIVDELDALGAIDGLKDALARLRKFGGRCVLGFQSIAQVSSTYGRGQAHTIVENCGITVILRCSASEGGGTSRFCSELIGQREVTRAEHSRGSSYSTSFFGSGGSHASKNVSYRQVTESAVMPAEIEQLPDLAGFLKVASAPAWMRVTFTLRP